MYLILLTRGRSGPQGVKRVNGVNNKVEAEGRRFASSPAG